MAKETYPNQRIVNIHREEAKSNFLGIKNENWKAASRDLRPHALLLYFYFAANKKNYKLALSPAAIQKEIGMPRSTYQDQFSILVNKGYLVHSHGNTYEFYEKPQLVQNTDKNSVTETVLDFENSTEIVDNTLNVAIIYPSEDREINNSELKDNEINREECPPVVAKKHAPFVF